MNRKTASIVVFALFAVLAVPATASARSKVSASFSARSSHGYNLHFLAKGKPDRMVALVQVSRLTDGRKAYESVADITDRGTTYDDGLLKSTVGDAKVKVRFEPAGGPGCSGTFAGKVRYRGDHGFTKASLEAVKGALRVNGKCPSKPAAPARALPVDASLVACGSGRTSGISYIVYRPRPRQAAHLTTRYEIGRHSQTIRDMGTLEPAKTFVVAPDFLSATVEPHGLYTGSGEYSAGALTGDLRGKLPGRGRSDKLTPLSAAVGPGEVSSDCSSVASAKRTLRGEAAGLYRSAEATRTRALR